MTPKRGSPTPRHGYVLCLLALLAVVAYLPTLRQPLLEDDYPLIGQAHMLGIRLLAHPLFELRWTSLLLMDGIYRLAGINAAAYYSLAILLHVINTGLVYALGYWRPLGYEITAWAAAFFAVHEGHQEGIMWISATNETLMFLFGVGSFLCWLRFLYERSSGRYGLSLGLFILALHSKESAVILVPMMALVFLFGAVPLRQMLWLIPFALLAGYAAARVAYTHTYVLHNDDRFSLAAPFWVIWRNSIAGLYWLWGVLAVGAILLWRPRRSFTLLVIGLLWSALALIPYSFLTYSTRVPSRLTYLASAGVALVVGFALTTLAQRFSRWALSAVCGVILVSNVGILWTKKRAQFLDRAAPTEQLIALARTTSGPIFMQCFPRPPVVAEWAVRLATGRADLIWDPARSNLAAATFCYSRK